MSENNIKHLSRSDIEIKAEEVLEYFDKSILEKVQFTPVLSIATQLKNEFDIFFDFTSELGTSSNGNVILGKFIFTPRGIYIDKSIVEDIRFPFVLAHEIGHLILHRKITLPKEGYEKFQDTEKDLVTGRKLLLSPRDWLEWQANQFASSFLMPRVTFLSAVIAVQKEIGITKNLGTVFVDNTNYSIRDFRRVIDGLANIFRTSKINTEFRMSDLGILVDTRMKNVKHISELLKEG